MKRPHCPKSLTTFPCGSTVKVCSLADSRPERARMCALGLTPGTCVQVLDSGNGCCRVRVRGSDLVLGEQMARCILAEKTDLDPPKTAPQI